MEKLLQLVRYEPETGRFFRLITTSGRGVAGREVGYVEPSTGYVRLPLGGREYAAHRVAVLCMTGQWPEPHTVDHANGNRADNTWSNLRRCDRRQNNRNLSKQRGCVSTLKGVTWHKAAGKWMAQIRGDSGKEYLGLHSTEEAAHAAYLEASKRLHGEFGRA